MRLMLFVPVLVSFGCAAADTSMIDQRAKGPESCTAGLRQSAGHQGSEISCRPQPGLIEQVGNALSGTASAFRAPGP